MVIDQLTEELVAALFDAFEQAGVLAVPAGRRVAVVELLTRVMTDPHLFAAYTEWLEVERDRRGLTSRMHALDCPDIPEDRIVAEGFVNLSDDVLADLALSPEALYALEDGFYGVESEVEPGEWFFAGREGHDLETRGS